MSDEYVARLSEMVDRLEAAYESARVNLRHEPSGMYEPEEMRDSSGRYILLDALVAIVEARTALARVSLR